MQMQGGQNICGIPIGVLCLESYFPKPPGHIKCPSSFRFPITYKVIKGVTVAKLLREPGGAQLDLFIAAARELEAEGVRAITGSCGFLALYQQELAAAVQVPVFASSLLQVPLVRRMLRPNQKVGVLTAHKASLTPAHLSAVGVDEGMVCLAGMEGKPEFSDVILEGKRHSMDLAKVESEVVEVAVSLAKAKPEVGAIVLECTDMPPFAYRIQQQTGLPVFDLSTLTNMVGEAVNRQPYSGIWPR
ncbi:MAG TPA: aspartate/glutamate racemase family protein [Noviherbaspirillum sp.]|nr:aspartate/glutamate racemase family protein [Noviherbaspirillum sp.]